MPPFMTWLLENYLTPAFWFQPVFYAFHGWIATEMVLWMLFHPYEAKYFPGTRIQIPLTPGIFPRGRVNLTEAIADTVTGTLLTEEDLHRQAEKLITEENLVRAVEALLDSVTRELQNTEQLRHIYRYGDEVIPDLLNQLLRTGLNKLEESLDQEQTGKLRAEINAFLAGALPGIRLQYAQAEAMTNMLFSTLLTPPTLRQLMLEGLSDGNILLIEKGVSSRVGGIKGLMVRFMGLDKSLTEYREFLAEHPAEAESQITEILDRLEIREKLAERMAAFSFVDLPEDTRQALLSYATRTVGETLVDNREEISGLVATWSGKASRLVINRLLQTNLKRWLNEERPELKRELARFMHRYLHRELALMIGTILPAIDIGQMIKDKMNQFSNQELERMIYGICQRELRWIALLGAFLGFWLGLLSNFVHYWLRAIQ